MIAAPNAGATGARMLCKNFKNGPCAKGDECPYSHNKKISARGETLQDASARDLHDGLGARVLSIIRKRVPMLKLTPRRGLAKGQSQELNTFSTV